MHDPPVPVADSARRSALDLLRRVRGWLSVALTSRHSFFVLVTAIFVFELVYRARLYVRLYRAEGNETPPLGFIAEQDSKLQLLAAVAIDAIVAFVAAAVIVMLASAAGRLLRGWNSTAGRSVEEAVRIAAVAVLGVSFAVHFSVLWTLGVPPSHALIRYALAGSAAGDYLEYASLADTVFLVSIIGLYLLFRFTPAAFTAMVRCACILVAVVALAAVRLAQLERYERTEAKARAAAGDTSIVGTEEIDPRLLVNPLLNASYALTGALTRSALPPAIASVPPRVEAAMRERLFVAEPLDLGLTRRPQTREWSILLVQMESVAAKYVTEHPGDRPLMPFTSELARQSIVARQHFSTGADTHIAVFSILTGLYPPTRPVEIVTRRETRYPTLLTEFAPRHRSIFVTPSDSRKWYPVGLLRNSNLTEFWDFGALPVKTRTQLFFGVKDELETAGFMTQRLIDSPDPFIGIYYPYATHFPYMSQEGAQDPLPQNAWLEKYHRSLALVDRSIETIVTGLRDSGRLDDTIVVITGDHGDAFGEHGGSRGHGLTLYNEIVHVPLILYQPELFAPAEIHELTSHVDLLPTLLDAAQLQSDGSRYQGESWLQPIERRYVYFYAPKSDLIGSVDRNLVKMLYDGTTDECVKFALRTDPQEQAPLPCEAGSPQLAATLALRETQTAFLVDYGQRMQPAAGIARGPRE